MDFEALNDPGVCGVRRCLTHTPLGAYPSSDLAKRNDRNQSPFVRSLNGTWKFRLTPSPATPPAAFANPQLDDSDWLDIPVPSNWQLDPRVSDPPIYTNIHYPFPPHPPTAPDVNPTGWYRTRFDVPAEWDGRRVFLCFESCDSACRVWVNGEDVGYSEDSKLPHEFDVTSTVRVGANDLAVMVPRYCSGFYLEDQDYWHLSGIQRDVVLYSKPPAHIRDYCVRTHFDDAFENATLEVETEMNEVDDLVEGYCVSMALYAPDGGEVWAEPRTAPVATHTPMGRGATHRRSAAHARIPVEAPLHWTAETPHLYTLVLSLVTPAGHAVDHESVRVGFRQVDIRDGVLRVNGQRLIVRGTNRHDHHPAKGRAMSVDDLRDEIIAMKRLNFNAVRTSHYPDHTAWYDLCDEYGIYVVDEANLETHGVHAQLSRDPAWMTAYLQRAQRMALRDRNHPCIVVWSLGNESGYGPHHTAMAAWLREFDPTRAVQYESGFPGPAISDIMVPMYPKLDWVREVLADPAETRPMIMCEYAYSKGNANGNFFKFWDMVEEYDRFQGGFVWDWAEKALVREVDGRNEWAYGNEFDGGIGPDGHPYGHDGRENPQMCLNGVVMPDLTPKPGAYELMKVQAPVRFTVAWGDSIGESRLTVANRYLALDLSHLEIEWALRRDGTVIASGSLPPLTIPPGSDEAIGMPADMPSVEDAGGEHFLSMVARHKNATTWCEAGHAVAWDHFAVPATKPRTAVSALSGTDEVRLRTEPDRFLVEAGQNTLEFDRETGELCELRKGGDSLLSRPLRHNFMRARTDNDYMIGNPGNYYEQWTVAGLDRLRTERIDCSATPLNDHLVLVRSEQRFAPEPSGAGLTVQTVYTIRGSGHVSVEAVVVPDASLPILPRIGMRCGVRNGLKRLRWYGRGPHESYPDRKHGALFGIHESMVEEQFFPFVDPCECGGHTDTRWIELFDEEGTALRVQGQPEFHFSALPYTQEELIRAGHVYELERAGDTILCIDGFHMGLGGDTGWSLNVHPEYLLPADRTYRYGFALVL